MNVTALVELLRNVDYREKLAADAEASFCQPGGESRVPDGMDYLGIFEAEPMDVVAAGCNRRTVQVAMERMAGNVMRNHAKDTHPPDIGECLGRIYSRMVLRLQAVSNNLGDCSFDDRRRIQALAAVRIKLISNVHRFLAGQYADNVAQKDWKQRTRTDLIQIDVPYLHRN